MPGTVTLADVNGDGNPDIVVPLLNIRYISIGVFIGNGGASFQPFVPYAISDSLIGYSASVVVGDVNGDHKPDIVVATRGAVPGLGKVSVFEGNGDGTFQPEIVALSGLSQPVSLVLADLNGDNKPDLIFTQIPTHPDPEIYVALGAGNSAFSAPSAVFPASEAVAVADMNGDGIPDIVTNTATILLGDGKGGFSPSPGYATAGVSPGDATGQVIVTDFDGDGLVDIVIADGSAAALSAGPSGSITVLFGRPGGAFFGPPLSSAPTISSTYSEIVTLPAADFNNDGIPDLASADIFGNINVLQGTANGFFKFVFASTLPGASGTPSDVVTGDFNHDGNIDFAVVSSQAVASGSGSVTVFPGKGDGTFQSPVTTPAPLGAFAAIPADFNGDGKLDLAVLINQENSGVKTTQSRVVIFSGNGDGTFTAGSSYPVNAGAQAITAGDFNRDGKQDLAVVSVTTGPDNQDGDVLFLSGRGDGTFTVGVDTVITGAASDGTVLAPTVTAADFNHDGNPDLVVSLPYPGAMVVLLGRGDGTFQTPVTYGSGFDFVTVGDLDGDGIPDLIATGSGQTGYFSGNGDGTFQPEAAFFGLSGPVAVADFNGDGKLDLAGLADGVLTGIVTLLNTSQAQSLKVVSGASFTAGPLAPDSIASVFGAHLATEIPSATSISVLDASGVSRPASLFFVSPAQVNLLIPDGTAAGAATLSATAFDTKPQTVQIQIVPVAPALFTLDSASLAAAYTVSVGPGSAQTDRAVYPSPSSLARHATSPIARPARVKSRPWRHLPSGCKSARAVAAQPRFEILNPTSTFRRSRLQ
jgi:hypothetical protein